MPARGGVEGGREPGPGAGGKQDVGVLAGHSDHIADHLAEGAANLNRRPFASHHQAAAQGKKAGREFDRQHPPPADRAFFLKGAFDLLDAAAAGLRSEAADQPDGEENHHRSQDGGEQPWWHRQVDGIAEQPDVPGKDPIHAEVEGGSQQAGQPSDDGGQKIDLEGRSLVGKRHSQSTIVDVRERRGYTTFQGRALAKVLGSPLPGRRHRNRRRWNRPGRHSRFSTTWQLL